MDSYKGWLIQKYRASKAIAVSKEFFNSIQRESFEKLYMMNNIICYFWVLVTNQP